MKKFLLLVAAATLTLGATAATPKIGQQIKTQESIQVRKAEQALAGKLVADVKSEKAQTGALRAKSAVTPEGTPVAYVFSDYYDVSDAVSVSKSEDGSKVYFSNMFPYTFAYPQEAWVQGNVSTDGISVTIPSDVAIAELEAEGVSYPVYPVEMLLDEEGYITGVQEIVFVKDGDKYYVDDDPDAPAHLLGLCALDENGEFLRYFDYTYLMAYEPYAGRTDLVELPEGAQPEEYTYMYVMPGLFGATQYVEPGLVYINGNDVYMNLLSTGYEGWVKGTKDGDKVTFHGDQFMNGGHYLVFQPFYTDGTTDEDNYLITYPCDVVFNYNAEKNSFVPVTEEGKDLYMGTFLQDGGLYNYAYDYLIGKVYDGPAVPADPRNLSMSWSEKYGQYILSYSLLPVGTEGEMLKMENLAYYIYLDGEQYTLTPDVFVELTEDMDLIPYGFTDDWDITDGEIWIAEPLASSLGVQAVYTVDDVTNYSNVVSVDIEGNVTTVPAPQLNPDGISNVTAKQITSVAIYDAEGRKLDAAQKGVNVVKMVAADGSVKTVKMFKK